MDNNSKIKNLKPSKMLFLGGGNMSQAIIKGLIAQGYNNPSILVVDRNRNKREFLSQNYKVQVFENISMAPHAETIFIAVKPHTAKDACFELKEYINNNHHLIVSIMAGISSQKLNEWLGAGLPIIRAMPNTPASIQAGATGIFATPKTSIAERQRVELILSSIGITAWFDQEADLNIITAISGSGPAYYFYFIELMSNIASKMGISTDIAQKFAIQTAYGAAKMARDSNESPAHLKEQVTSKKGTTEAALNIMQEHNLAILFEKAIESAYNKAIELSKT